MLNELVVVRHSSCIKWRWSPTVATAEATMADQSHRGGHKKGSRKPKQSREHQSVHPDKRRDQQSNGGEQQRSAADKARSK
jgi:hypothetical protein